MTPAGTSRSRTFGLNGTATRVCSTFNNVLVRLRTVVFLITGAYVIFSIEPLGGFDPPMAQSKGVAKKNILSHFQHDPPLCGTVRAFSRIFSQLWQTGLFIRIDPRYILEPLIDLSTTIEQCISAIAPARAFV